MTRSSYCRYRESMGQRQTIKKPEKGWNPRKEMEQDSMVSRAVGSPSGRRRARDGED